MRRAHLVPADLSVSTEQADVLTAEVYAALDAGEG
jgi:hypothetical protein